MLNAKLVVVGGDAKKAEVQLNLPTIIGRGKEAGLTVPHALVSRRHTEIFEREGQLFVRDLGSSMEPTSITLESKPNNHLNQTNF